MSLLTTFGILFDVQSKKAKKDIDDVEKSLDNTEKQANDTAGSVDDLSTSVDDSSKSFVGLSDRLVTTAAALTVITGLFAGLVAQAASTDEIGKFSETLGLSIEDVGAWGEAVKRSGGSVSGFRSTLAGLNDQLTNIRINGGGQISETLARLGINVVGKNAVEVLKDVSDAFKNLNLSKSESAAYGKMIGLDQGTILLLQQGRVAVEDLVNRQKALGVANKEDAKAAADFNDALADTQQASMHLFTTVGTTILPMITSMIRGFESVSSWISEHQSLVTGFFIGVAGAITYMYLPAIISAGAATLATMSPFIIIGGAIAAVGVAFAVLYEDVVAYLGGQGSFIGDLAKKYTWFGDIVEGVVDGIKLGFNSLTEIFDRVMSSIPDIANSLKNSLGSVKDFFGFGDDELRANMDKSVSITGEITNNPLNGQTSASIINSQQSSSRVNNVNVGGTTINTQSTDAEGIASAVGSNLNNQVTNAISQFDDAEAY